MSPPRRSRTVTSTRATYRSDANLLAGTAAGHAASAIFLDAKALARQKRALKAIFTRFLTAANTWGCLSGHLPFDGSYPSKWATRVRHQTA